MSELNLPTEPTGPVAPTPLPPAQPPLSIWRDMWLKPRAVLRQQVTAPSHWQLWAPAMLAGIAAVLETFMLAAQQPDAAPALASESARLPTGQALLLTALLLGPLFGMLHVGLMGFVLRQFGKLFGGVTTPDAMRRGISLSLVPLAFSLPLVLFELWWREQNGGELVVMLTTALRAGLNLWTLLLLAMSISELQQLPMRRAVATLASAVAALILLLLLLQPR